VGSPEGTPLEEPIGQPKLLISGSFFFCCINISSTVYQNVLLNAYKGKKTILFALFLGYA
jgi:hypothetical protein